MAIELSNTNEAPNLDEVDRRLLARLMRQGRATWADLADELGLTAPAIAQRVRRLEDRGVIKHFAAWVAPEAIAPICAFVSVRLDDPDQDEAFRAQMEGFAFIQECQRISGDDDYLLKVRCGSLLELETAVTSSLRQIPGVRTRTTVVLSTVKDTPQLPIAGLVARPS
jgi:Lrp/AsnC family leucine-responsive transcriptional regulator